MIHIQKKRFVCGPKARFSMVSSTLIRERLKCGDSISELVPPGCVSLVEKCYAEKIA